MDGIDVMAKPQLRLIVPWAKVKRIIKNVNRLAPELNIEVRGIALDGLRRLKEETPRSAGQGVHIADAWRVTFKTVGGLIREARLKNDPRNDLVLMCLETGTKPHRIPTSGNKILHFKVGGTEVWAQNVMHKGSKAFKMVETTRRAMEIRVSVALRTALQRYSSRFRG